MKTIRMFSTAAGPERVLHAGQVYTLPDDAADELLGGKLVHGQTQDGRPILGGPCAVEVRGVRGKQPGRPDPQEFAAPDDDDQEEDEE